MYRKKPLLSKPQRLLPRVTLVVGIIWLNILGLLGNVATTYASSTPGGNIGDPVVRAVDIAKPAVVRIITVVDGRLTVHFPGSPAVTFPRDGTLYHMGLSGSGAFISAHGDILTADHVVNPPPEVLDEFAAPEVTQYYNQHSSNPASQDQITQWLITGQLPSDPHYGTPSTEVFLSTDYTGQLSATNIQGIPRSDYAIVDRIEKQSAFNDKDVAIIHVNNMNDKASIQLGDSSAVQEQDELTIIGFPGNGDVNTTSPTDLLTSSVNKVFVSSIKTTNSQAPVIQVGGNVEQGDSGGPALDSNGNVVGIVSFGSVGSGSTSFLQASASARALVQSLHLETAPGRFQTEWKQAFTDYSANTPGHWHKAQQEFKQIAASYPSFKAITPYLNYASDQAKNEPLLQPQAQQAASSSLPNNMLWVLLGAVVVILLVLLLFAGVVLRRRRAGQIPATLAVGQSFNATPPGASPQGQGRGMNPAHSMYAPQSQMQPQPRQANSMAAFGAPDVSAAPPGPVQQSAQPPRPMPGYARDIRNIPASPPWVVPPPPVQPQVNPVANNPANPARPPIPAGNSGALVPWPCGHMNRPVARFCSVCGEPAPPSPTIRKYEQ